jgi:hypothetical protein
MYQQPRMGSTAEARQAESPDRIPHGLYYGWYGDYDPRHDDEIHLSAVERFLPREAGVTEQAVSQIFRLCNATDKNVGYDSRLDKLKSHGDVLPARLVVVACASAKSPLVKVQSHCATGLADYSTGKVKSGFQIVKGQS